MFWVCSKMHLERLVNKTIYLKHLFVFLHTIKQHMDLLAVKWKKAITWNTWLCKIINVILKQL